MDSGELTAPPVRVLLVDDHPAVRQGLTILLAPEGIEVCAQAGGRTEALARVAEQRPDVAIVDLSLDGEDGLDLVADLHGRDIPVLVYSMHNDPPRVVGAFAAGALGYVTKREFDPVLVEAVRQVAKRCRFASPIAAAALAESVTGSLTGEAFQMLSPHERKVYELLGQGRDTFEIAAALEVSKHTVHSYCERIKIKLNLTGMHELRRHAADFLQKRPR
jgi:DNA-binding NarL/FixJ family response regulator